MINTALEAAAEGDVICLKPGHYTDSSASAIANVDTAGVTIRGVGADPEDVVIGHESDETCDPHPIDISVPMTLRNVTLRNCCDYGYGFWIQTSDMADHVMFDTVIVDLTGATDGTLGQIEQGSVSLIDCKLTGAVSTNSRVLDLYSGNRFVIRNCRFENNTAVQAIVDVSNSAACGVEIDAATTFTGNSADALVRVAGRLVNYGYTATGNTITGDCTSGEPFVDDDVSFCCTETVCQVAGFTPDTGVCGSALATETAVATSSPGASALANDKTPTPTEPAEPTEAPTGTATVTPGSSASTPEPAATESVEVPQASPEA